MFTQFIFLLLIIQSIIYAQENTSILSLENFNIQDTELTLWIAIILLSFVALLSIYISSRQIVKLKKKFDTQSQIKHEEDKMLSEMSENIQNIAKTTVATAKKISTYDEDVDISTDIAKVVRSENKLLSITTDIIEFLRIKSKKTNVVNEKFKLSNLLNDISGTLKANTKDIDFTLIYDVKGNIPENLFGDTLNLSKIIVNIILFCIQKDSDDITLKISKNSMFNQEDHLCFEISSNLQLNVEESGNIFNSNYDEKSESYESLGLFIANELSILMRGELIARNNKLGQVEFVFNIPFEEDHSSKVPADDVTSKKVLVLDSSSKSATITKNLLSELNHSAKISISDNFLDDLPNFSKYDLSIIEDKLFNSEILNKAKRENCKIITVSNLFQNTIDNTRLQHVDAQLMRPLISKQISYTINNLFSKQKTTEDTQTKPKQSQQPILVYKSKFADTQNIDLFDFAKFRNTRVLLVEDNLINQKVFVGMLSKSGMQIDIANDGKEALDMLSANPLYGMIFMDINMPIMDGYTASIKIREQQQYDEIPIVALTALTSVSEVEKMFDCNMNGFLPKPLKKGQLYTVFTKFIKDVAPERRSESRNPTQKLTLDGLNIETGIANSSSNEVFYKEILIEFKDAYGHSQETFEKLIVDFRYEQLKMLCIDIKGLCGSIGAEDMHKLVTKVLQDIAYKKHDEIPNYIERYKEELYKLNRSIESYLS